MRISWVCSGSIARKLPCSAGERSGYTLSPSYISINLLPSVYLCVTSKRCAPRALALRANLTRWRMRMREGSANPKTLALYTATRNCYADSSSVIIRGNTFSPTAQSKQIISGVWSAGATLPLVRIYTIRCRYHWTCWKIFARRRKAGFCTEEINTPAIGGTASRP